MLTVGEDIPFPMVALVPIFTPPIEGATLIFGERMGLGDVDTVT